MKLDPGILKQLASETGRTLGRIGVRAEDRRWIEAHAATIASLGGSRRRRSSVAELIHRLARRAARTAR